MAVLTQAGKVQVVVDFDRLLQQHNAALHGCVEPTTFASC